jgi:hypothetical protein
MRFLVSALVLSTVLATTAAQSPAFAADAIGEVAAAVGTPSVSGPGGDRVLKAGSAVYEDDKIVVRSGNAQIILNDGTKLVVGPGSTLVLDRFLMTGGNTVQKVSIKALRGTFRFITGKSAKSAYDIQTANATIGIRGTGFDFWVKQQTGAAVHVGSVTLCSTESSKNCVALHEGCEVGRAGGDEARKLTGQVKGKAISSNFPYILSQALLNAKFRLPIQSCGSSLRRSRGREGGGELPSNDNQGRGTDNQSPGIDNRG